MTRNYKTVREIRQNNRNLDRWADVRETCVPVAAAIHAIADNNRPASLIWEEPTRAETDHITMALEQYMRDGEIDAPRDGRFPWGCDAVQFVVCESPDGWSLHAPNSMDADIADGSAPPVVSYPA